MLQSKTMKTLHITHCFVKYCFQSRWDAPTIAITNVATSQLLVVKIMDKASVMSPIPF